MREGERRRCFSVLDEDDIKIFIIHFSYPYILKLSKLALVGDFHVEIFVDRQVDKESLVKEIICALDFIVFYGSFVLDVLVAARCREVLHKGDL